MKVFFLVISLVLLLGSVFCEEVLIAGRGVDAVYRGETCTVSPESIEAVKNFIAAELNTGSLSFYNVTSSYCYEYDDYSSISVTVLFKEDESSIMGKSVNANFYTQTTYDYSLVFTDEELGKLDYTLKDKYMNYLVEGGSEEFYVMMSSYEDCSPLVSYYDSLSGEKYFNQDSCSVVFKTSTEEVKSMSSAPADYIYYLGETINFVFSSYSTGSYDLEELSESIDCASESRYYISGAEGGCSSYYNSDTLVYFSSSTSEGDDSYAYFNAYGIIGGGVEFSVGAYGMSDSSVKDWVDDLMSEYFPDYSLSLSFEGDDYKYYSVVERDFSFDQGVLSGFETNDYEMNTFYSMDDTYVTITKPYIQVYVNDYQVASSSEVIMPRYPSNYFIVTDDKVFSTAVLSENDEETAARVLTDLVDDYVSVGDWVLEMTVSGGWYYPYPMPLMDREEGDYGMAADSDSGNAEILNLLQSETAGNLASMNMSKFDELKNLSEEKKGIIAGILDFLANLFS